MSDFMLFWLAKTVAEIAFSVILLVLCVVALSVIEHRNRRSRKKQKGQP